MIFSGLLWQPHSHAHTLKHTRTIKTLTKTARGMALAAVPEDLRSNSQHPPVWELAAHTCLEPQF